MDEALEALADEDEILRGEVSETLADWRERREELLDGLADRGWPETLTSAPAAAAKSSLEKLADEAEAKLTEAERASGGEERRNREAEAADLAARVWLTGVIDEIERHAGRMDEAERLAARAKQVSTRHVTAMSKKLAESFLNEPLREAFASEIGRVCRGVRNLEVTLDAKTGRYGAARCQPSLPGLNVQKPGEVVSEGEMKGIALAAFVAELATEPCRSAVVLEDPVTSLDDRWRDAFADRLVELAGERQVVVFTHSLAFASRLAQGATNRGLPLTTRTLGRRGTTCGIVSDDMYELARSPKERLHGLEEEFRKLSKRSGLTDDEVDAAVGHGYDRLRSLLESVVEMTLAGGVVKRHDTQVHVSNIWKLTLVEKSWTEPIYRLHKKCSDAVSSHSDAPVDPGGVPTPGELLEDCKKLQDLEETMRKRVANAQRGREKIRKTNYNA